MVYYLFNPLENINNPYWYKYLDIYDTTKDYLWSYRPECYFQSRLFTVYICKRHESFEEITYNICKLDSSGNILLYYNDDVVFIETDKRRDTEVLKILNKYCSRLRRID